MNFLLLLLATFVLGNGVCGQNTGDDPFRRFSFTCLGRPPGYYADLETGCKTYHVCDGVSHFTYVCPKRTLFRQSSRICDHSYLVTCGEEPPSGDEDEVLIRQPKTNTILLREEGNDRQDEVQTESLPPAETAQDEDVTEIPTTTFIAAFVATTQKPPLESPNPEEKPFGTFARKFLKFHLKDPRSLFFIPELQNNSVEVGRERELVLPVEKDDVMRFRTEKKVSHTFSACPKYCNPRFFLPGTCHPCIMIK